MKWIAQCLMMLVGFAEARADGQQAFWVWHRSDALTATETQRLLKGGINRLYWHIGTVSIGKDALRWMAAPSQQPQPVDGLMIVPVIRGSFADGVVPNTTEPLAHLLLEQTRQWSASMVQLDFDCPDRLLEDYGVLLTKLRQKLRPTQLSITALAGCISSPHFTDLQDSVDELQPMFYDLEPEFPADIAKHQAHPICEPSLVNPLLKAWSEKCQARWWAGLPMYHRVTLFDAAGASRGHLRKWDWQALAGLPGLQWSPDSALRWATVTKEAKIGESVLDPGNQLAVRTLDAAAVQELRSAVNNTTAVGINWFRLPEKGLVSGVSLPQALALVQGIAGQPRVGVNLVDGRLILAVTEADLFPRLPQADGSGLWRLELRSEEGAVFREAAPGQFVRSEARGGGARGRGFELGIQRPTSRRSAAQRPPQTRPRRPDPSSALAALHP